MTDKPRTEAVTVPVPPPAPTLADVLEQITQLRKVVEKSEERMGWVIDDQLAANRRMDAIQRAQDPGVLVAPPLAAPRPASFTNEVKESMRAVAIQQQTVADQQKTVADQQAAALDAARVAAERAQKNIEEQEKTKRLGIVVPVLAGLVTVAGTVIVALIASANNRAALQDMEARQATRTLQLSAAIGARPAQTLPPYLLEPAESSPLTPASLAPPKK